jgi:hypothetical protein
LSFFPVDQRSQLLTVRSCDLHNSGKSKDDVYVLAQICLNASPRNGSREILLDRVIPQLGYNDGALRKTLANNAEPLSNGAVRYKVDMQRLDRFFAALSYGVISKVCGSSLPAGYLTTQLYHNIEERAESEVLRMYKQAFPGLCSELATELNFGSVKTLNEAVYSVKLIGLPGFKSSITLVHTFFGFFQVTSLLTKRC